MPRATATTGGSVSRSATPSATTTSALATAVTAAAAGKRAPKAPPAVQRVRATKEGTLSRAKLGGGNRHAAKQMLYPDVPSPVAAAARLLNPPPEPLEVGAFAMVMDFCANGYW